MLSMERTYTGTTKMHWTQRIALARHSLTAAIRTRDFTFFKSFQAYNLALGTNHVASLSAILHNDADALISTLDRANAVVAYVYEDAFKSMYASITAASESEHCFSEGRRAIYTADMAKQLHLAASSVDKMVDLAVSLIQQQSSECHEDAAMVFIMGMSFIADAVDVCLCQTINLENIMNDSVRLETSMNLVQGVVASSISAMKSVFSLMNTESPSSPSEDHGKQRSPSVDWYARGILRRMSGVLTTSVSMTDCHTGTQPRKTSTYSDSSRRGSGSSIVSHRRSYFSSQPTPLPMSCPVATGGTHTLSPIPPTPGSDMLGNPLESNASLNTAVFRQNSFAGPAVKDRASNMRRDSMAISPTASKYPTPVPTPAPASPDGEAATSPPVRPLLADTMPSEQSITSSVADSVIYEADPLIMSPPSCPQTPTMRYQEEHFENNPSLLRRMSKMMLVSPGAGRG